MKKKPLRTKIETHEYWFYFNKFKLNLIQARKNKMVDTGNKRALAMNILDSLLKCYKNIKYKSQNKRFKKWSICGR